MAPKKPAKPKVRAPEEVWYDVHKHPKGVPGGMGKSPEYHLRRRGWNGHEINEGSGKKTIQYRNNDHPDFVISYGGGTAQKPDHNFRVLYMGTNANIPKVHRAYSVAEAMNKVEELHQLHNGLVVQPMTHSAAGPLGYEFAIEGPDGLVCPNCGSSGLYSRGFRARQEDPDLGCNDCREKMHSPEGYPVVSDSGWERGGDAFGMAHDASVKTPPSQQKQPAMPAIPKPAAPRDMTEADAYPQFPAQPEHERTWNNPNLQLKEIPDPPPIRAPKPGPTKAYNSKAPEGPLMRAFSAFKLAQQSTWEDDDDQWPGDDTDYYHGTTEEDLDQVSPATSHRKGVVFPHQSDPEYAYVTPSVRNAWHYAELAWNAKDGGIPRVYRVRATGPVEEDPTHWPNGESRGNFSDDVRSRHPFEVHEELPTPEHWLPEDDEEGWEA